MAFNEGPHTSFGMVKALMDYLRETRKLDVTYRTLLDNREVLLQAFADGDPVKGNIEGHPWVGTWSGKAGRCTSFAVKVARALEAEYPTVFNFQYFDVHMHRVARCEKTQILIDSASDDGVKRMPPNPSTDGTHWQDASRHTKYKYRADGYSVYEAKESGEGNAITRCPAYPISPAEAMSTCLREVAKKMVLVCSFRYVANDR